jgi:hypothetical protein
MLDLSHIPNSQQDVKIFNAISGSNSWQTWQKPRKCNYVWIMCIGGGGGGGWGTNFNNGITSTGGGAGGVSRALYNAQQLPDRLYVQVGLGGAGGVSGANGSPGTRSWVSLQQATTIVAQNIVQGSGAAVAAGGIVGGTGGNAAGETAVTQTTVTFLTLANFTGLAGVTAVNNNVTQAPDVTPLSSQITCQGANGSSNSAAILGQNGGSILSSSISPLIPGGIGVTASGSNATNGANGITSWKPFFSTGGAGGGSAVSGSGGNGGNGGIGSGGGGGGGSAGFFVAGNGGKGGDGLVVIISF